MARSSFSINYTSLSGYATQAWANTQFIDTSEMTTISGDIIDQIPNIDAMITNGEQVGINVTYSPGEWLPIWEGVTYLDQDSSVSSYGYRQIHLASTISGGGPYVRLSVIGNSQYDTVFTHVCFGERSGSTANVVGEFGSSTFKEVLFGGLSGVTIPSGQVVVSDPLLFAVDETKDYLSIYSAPLEDPAYERIGNGEGFYQKAGGYTEYNVAEVIGYSLMETLTYATVALEVVATIDPSLNFDAQTAGDLRYTTQTQLTTTSGDIIAQIPSLTGYATQSWTNTNFPDNTELTTTSGDIVAQIPSLAGYATQDWANTQFIDTSEMTTISGNIVAKIAPAVTYENLSANSDIGTASTQVAQGDHTHATYATSTQLTTTSGDIVSQIPTKVRYLYYTIDNNGTTITTGSKLWTTFPYAGTINQWWVSADASGSISIDVWKAAWGTMPTATNKISSSAGPSLSTAQFNTSSSLGTWTTTTVTGMDTFVFNVASCTTCTRAVIALKITCTS